MKLSSLQVADVLRSISRRLRPSLNEAIIRCGVLLSPETPPGLARRRQSGVNTFQMPNQLAPFLLHLDNYRIRNYLEAGSFLGGTFYIVDSYLRLTQAGYEGGTAIDIANRMQDFEANRAVHPETRFFETRSVDFDPGRTPPQRGGQAHFAHTASQNEPVPDPPEARGTVPFFSPGIEKRDSPRDCLRPRVPGQRPQLRILVAGIRPFPPSRPAHRPARHRQHAPFLPRHAPILARDQASIPAPRVRRAIPRPLRRDGHRADRNGASGLRRAAGSINHSRRHLSTSPSC